MKKIKILVALISLQATQSFSSEIDTVKDITYHQIDSSVYLGNVLDNRNDCEEPEWEETTDAQGRTQIIYSCELESSTSFIKAKIQAISETERTRETEIIKDYDIGKINIKSNQDFKNTDFYKAYKQADDTINAIYNITRNSMYLSDTLACNQRADIFLAELTSNNIENLINESNALKESVDAIIRSTNNSEESSSSEYTEILNASTQLQSSASKMKDLLTSDPYIKANANKLSGMLALAAQTEYDLTSISEANERGKAVSIRKLAAIENYTKLNDSALKQVIVWNIATDGSPYISGMAFGLTKDQETLIQTAISQGSFDAYLRDAYQNHNSIENSPLLNKLTSDFINKLLEKIQSEQQAQQAQQGANQNTTTESCIDSWISSYRKEAGEETTIAMEQLDEWDSWCSEGKRP